MPVQWILKKFDELTTYELYDIIHLRNEVFVVEQNCVFQDADYKDLKAWHLLGRTEEGLLCAYCRILPAGISYSYVSIGRVVTAPSVRKTGMGKQLMATALKFCHELFGHTQIQIGAQLYLKKFYESFGFRQSSEVYLEDGIEHIEMIRTRAEN